ncbi:uncharacterized protein RJT20DRAFT_11656 [Scheffersomyces xylosifermentans]|uniref:uncharacterized protein n=1 Tax=Scheffersomyces xylosifermentans TaxID=1304137 RepID=UPI00315CA7A0
MFFSIQIYSLGHLKNVLESVDMTSLYLHLDSVIDKSDLSTKDSSSVILLFTTTISDSLVSFLQDEYNFETALRLLKDLKQQLRIRSLKDPFQRFKSLITDLFTKLVLNYLSRNDQKSPWKKVQFSYNDYGKPLLKGQEFQFNSSSSNKVISLAVEYSKPNSPVGIDLSHSVQSSISPTDFLEQFHPIFAVTELEHLNSIKDINERYFAFNHLWTLKEAYTKLLGSGLNIQLADFSFTITGESFAAESFRPRSLLQQSGFISEYRIPWYSDISVDNRELINKEDSFVKALENQTEFYCFSSILEKGTLEELPVIVTIINQNRAASMRYFAIDFLSILQLQI